MGELAAPIAAGAAAGASAAAAAAAAAACTAAAAAVAAAIAACATAATSCTHGCECCRPAARVRSPMKQPVALQSTPSDRAKLIAEPPPPPPTFEPVTPRRLAAIETDEELLPRHRAAEHLLHAIAEANEQLITPGIVARLGWDTALTMPHRHIPRWDFGGHGFARDARTPELGDGPTACAVPN